MKNRLCVLVLALFFVKGCSPVIENDYRSPVDINKKNPNDKRKYKTFVLANSLQVLLIQDTELKKSAAAIDVNVGSLEDPWEHLGLAHFLEHMLFLGTKKYPVVGEYKEYLNSHQGYSNAYTSAEHTNYHFEVNHDGFEGALDRFAQFFISPSFAKKYVEREMNAVNSEHQKNLQNDYWRARMVERLTHRKGHPRQKFSTGTKETLKNVKREQLIAFYKQHYSANTMKLVILSNTPLKTQEQWVKKMFGDIKNTARKPLIYDPEIFDKKKLPQQIMIRPVTEKMSLKIAFAAPSTYKYWRTKPYSVLGHLLGHEGEGSLLSLLKKENLVTSLSAGASSSSYAGTFETVMSLTQNGQKKVDRIVELFFSYIKLLKKEGYKTYLYREVRTMDDINYFYREPQEGTGVVSSFANLMHYYPALELEKNSWLIYDYSEKDYQTFLSYMSPEKARLVVQGPKVPYDKVEAYYGTHYRVSKISASKVKKWKEVTINPDLHFPASNPFIPTNLGWLGNDKRNKPVKIVDDARGVFWFQQDKTFKVPKGSVYLLIHTKEANKTARGKLLSLLYTRALAESLNEWKYFILLAGLSFDVSRSNRGILIRFNGYSERIPDLMRSLFQKLRSITIDEQRFLALKNAFGRDFNNFDFEQAYRQSLYHLDAMTDPHAIHRSEYKNLIETIKLSEVTTYANTLYKEISIEALAYGNFSESHLNGIVDDVYKTLGAKAMPLAERLDSETHKLKPGHPVGAVFSSKSNNNCWVKNVQFGPRSTQLNVSLRIGSVYLEPGFYGEMRTKQQLGYIVFSGHDFHKKSLGMYFIIQSGQYPADDIAKRADTWLTQAIADMDNMTDQQFATLRDGVITKLSQKDKTIKEKMDKLIFEALIMEGNFGYNQKLITAAKKLTKQQVTQTFKQAFDPDKKRQLTIYFQSWGDQPLLPKETVYPSIKAFKKDHDIY